MTDREWREVSKATPCPACGKPDWCAWTREGWLKCERTMDTPDGFVRVSAKDGGAVFKPAEAPSPNGRNRGSRRVTASPVYETPAHGPAGRGFVDVDTEGNSDTHYPTECEAVAELERRHGAPSALWTYRDAAGDPVGVVIRWNREDGSKRILPASRNGSGWVLRGMPNPRPLYALPELVEGPAGSTVYVTEGEKAADVVRSCGLLATTSPHGSNSAGKADWSPVAGRDLVILPDHDDPGEKYAAAVARLAAKAGARSVRLVRLADRWKDLPLGGDAADVLDLEGGDAEAVRAGIEALAAGAERTDTSGHIFGANGSPLLHITSVGDLGPAEPVDWVWPNYLARGAITLFTGLWKAGKTTLLAHLLRDLRRGGGLVERPIGDDVLVLTEEPTGVWANRRDDLDLDPSVHIAKRDTLGRPTADEWARIIGGLAEQVKAGSYAVVVIDTLPSWWPVLNENDAGETSAALAPLRAISDAGAAVLLVHHPRKGDGQHGTATRGSGALPGFVDVLVELRRHTEGPVTQRVLSALSRLDANPDDLIIDLTDDGYVIVGGRSEAKADAARETIARILSEADSSLTAEEVHEQWPEGSKRPKVSKLRGYLNEAHNLHGWPRSGNAVKGDPYRYSVPVPAPGKGGTEWNPSTTFGVRSTDDDTPSNAIPFQSSVGAEREWNHDY
jgi:hypothetical protein